MYEVDDVATKDEPLIMINIDNDDDTINSNDTDNSNDAINSNNTSNTDNQSINTGNIIILIIIIIYNYLLYQLRRLIFPRGY